MVGKSIVISGYALERHKGNENYQDCGALIDCYGSLEKRITQVWVSPFDSRQKASKAQFRRLYLLWLWAYSEN